MPLASEPKRINRRKREQTRAGLLDAAMSVFALSGPDAVAVDDIIRAAGVSHGTFYNYFANPEALLTAVAATLSDELLTQIEPVRSLPDPADRMACSVRTFIRKAAADPKWGWVIVRIALVAAPLGQNMRGFLAADIADGLALRRFRAKSAQVAADIVLGSALMGMRSVLRGEAAAGHAEAIAAGVLRALGVDDADALVRLPLHAEAIAARARTRPARSPGQAAARRKTD